MKHLPRSHGTDCQWHLNAHRESENTFDTNVKEEKENGKLLKYPESFTCDMPSQWMTLIFSC